MLLSNGAVCDEYNFEAQIQIYMVQQVLANTNTNIYGLIFVLFYTNTTVFGSYLLNKYKIYLGVSKMGECEYKYQYLYYYLQIQIWIQILSKSKKKWICI